MRRRHSVYFCIYFSLHIHSYWKQTGKKGGIISIYIHVYNSEHFSDLKFEERTVILWLIGIVSCSVDVVFLLSFFVLSNYGITYFHILPTSDLRAFLLQIAIFQK